MADTDIDFLFKPMADISKRFPGLAGALLMDKINKVYLVLPFQFHIVTVRCLGMQRAHRLIYRVRAVHASMHDDICYQSHLARRDIAISLFKCIAYVACCEYAFYTDVIEFGRTRVQLYLLYHALCSVMYADVRTMYHTSTYHIPATLIHRCMNVVCCPMLPGCVAV